MPRRLVIYTIGHSTRSLAEFIEILHAHGIAAIADVRRFPKSRRYPHFNDDSLAKTLPEAGIEYLSFAELGGRRRPAKDSVNTAWRSDAFRGYADFMQTAEFREGLERLQDEARKRPLAIMCAEAVPWRCHRSLISDALVARGWEVREITGPSKPRVHKLPEFAKVNRRKVTYPGEGDRLAAADGDEKQKGRGRDERRSGQLRGRGSTAARRL